MIGSLLGTVRYITGNSLNSPLNESDYLGPENFSSLPRDAQLQDQQVSCFSEGTPTPLVMTRNSSWLGDPVPSWGMLGCEEEFPPPYDFRTHIQVHNPNTSDGGQTPQIISGRSVPPTFPISLL